MRSQISQKIATTQATRLQDPETKRKSPTRIFTIQVKQEILYRWIHAGQLTSEISRRLGIFDRDAMERVVQREMTPRGPAPCLITRRAA